MTEPLNLKTNGITETMIESIDHLIADFYSAPAVGIIDRNRLELGEDRALTIRLLQNGFKCVYDPRYTPIHTYWM
jgi:hypothetical protein